MTYQWANPIRVPSTDAMTIAERTHVPDPAAVAHLRALMAVERAERAAAEAAAAERRAAGRRLLREAAARRIAQAQAKVKAQAEAEAARAERAAQAARAKEERAAQPRKQREQMVSEDVARALHARYIVENGPSQVTLAAEIGVNASTLRRAFRRHGLAVKGNWGHHRGGRPRRVDADGLRALHVRYLADEPSDALAAEFGWTVSWLLRQFRRAGLATHSRGGSPAGHGRRTLTPDEIAYAVAAHDAGQRWIDIAAGMGMGKRVLRREVIAAQNALQTMENQQ